MYASVYDENKVLTACRCKVTLDRVVDQISNRDVELLRSTLVGNRNFYIVCRLRGIETGYHVIRYRNLLRAIRRLHRDRNVGKIDLIIDDVISLNLVTDLDQNNLNNLVLLLRLSLLRLSLLGLGLLGLSLLGLSLLRLVLLLRLGLALLYRIYILRLSRLLLVDLELYRCIFRKSVVVVGKLRCRSYRLTGLLRSALNRNRAAVAFENARCLSGRNVLLTILGELKVRPCKANNLLVYNKIKAVLRSRNLIGLSDLRSDLRGTCANDHDLTVHDLSNTLITAGEYCCSVLRIKLYIERLVTVYLRNRVIARKFHGALLLGYVNLVIIRQALVLYSNSLAGYNLGGIEVGYHILGNRLLCRAAYRVRNLDLQVPYIKLLIYEVIRFHIVNNHFDALRDQLVNLSRVNMRNITSVFTIAGLLADRVFRRLRRHCKLGVVMYCLDVCKYYNRICTDNYVLNRYCYILVIRSYLNRLSNCCRVDRSYFSVNLENCNYSIDFVAFYLEGLGLFTFQQGRHILMNCIQIFLINVSSCRLCIYHNLRKQETVS